MFEKITIWLTKMPLIVALCTFMVMVSTSYVAFGLPVPATRAYLEERLLPFKSTLRDMKVLIISNSLDQLDTRKGILRAERLVLERDLSDRISVSARQNFNMRLAQITDELSAIDRRRDDLAKRSDDIEKIQ